MNIYIYGSKSFKNNIHNAFEHSNMKFRLNDNDSIIDLNSLNKLKDAIRENPKNIFLIDEEKIIRKNSLNEKLNLFKDKDRIEEEFLKEFGVIGNLSVDSISDIPSIIIKKLEEEHKNLETLEDLFEEEKLNEEPIYLNNKVSDKNFSKNKNDKIDIENLNKDDDFGFLGDELDNLFDFGNELSFDAKKNVYEDKRSYDINLEDDDFGLVVEEIVNKSDNTINEDDDFGLIIEDIENNKIEEKGNNNMENNEFSELDNLSENDLIEALGGSSTTKSTQKSVEKKAEVELNSSSVNDLSALITQLLNNKTLEITIKIKE